MPQPDDGRGNLYEQVLEYAKREMDEAASKMEDIKQSLQLLEARVEAAKAVYQAVASRLNLEDEADGAAFDTSYPEAPVQAPEPPPAETAPITPITAILSDALPASPPVAPPPAEAPPVVETPAPAEAPAPEPPAMEEVVSDKAPVSQESTTPPPASPDTSDLDIIRQHRASKAERENDATPAPTASTPPPEPVAPAPAADTSGQDDDSFSMQLIRQHLEQKAQD